MKKIKALFMALLCAVTLMPLNAGAYTSFRSSSFRSPSYRSVYRPSYRSTPRAYSRPTYRSYSSHTTVIHESSPLHSPWFWMWAMDHNQPQTTVVAAPPAVATDATPVTVVQQDTSGAWVFVTVFIGGLVLIGLVAIFIL